MFETLPHSATVQTLVLVLSNGAIFWILAKLVPGIEVKGILPAIVAPVVFTVLSGLVWRYGAHVDFVALCEKAIEKVTELRDWISDSGAATPAAPGSPHGAAAAARSTNSGSAYPVTMMMGTAPAARISRAAPIPSRPGMAMSEMAARAKALADAFRNAH